MNDDHHSKDALAAPASQADLDALSPLGRWLEENRAPVRAAAWKKALLAVLAALALVNFLLRPSEPHFGLDAWPLFWPAFGLAVGAVMVWLVKKVIQPYFLVQPEDYYDDL